MLSGVGYSILKKVVVFFIGKKWKIEEVDQLREVIFKTHKSELDEIHCT
jgi:hypothetical protein